MIYEYNENIIITFEIIMQIKKQNKIRKVREKIYFTK